MQSENCISIFQFTPSQPFLLWLYIFLYVISPKVFFALSSQFLKEISLNERKKNLIFTKYVSVALFSFMWTQVSIYYGIFIKFFCSKFLLCFSQCTFAGDKFSQLLSKKVFISFSLLKDIVAGYRNLGFFFSLQNFKHATLLSLIWIVSDEKFALTFIFLLLDIILFSGSFPNPLLY